ncbi:DUF262 domain-containing protein [Luteolibacter sp. LG18]|uniref:DUF262 domain-containing protein n=1 Tax=Luteolibacter sp. LG18 TaxID=2819286 RepID=UPI002B30BB37|nr:hypothetical protein llg_14610 [Luteolibacter sp. LG18]
MDDENEDLEVFEETEDAEVSIKYDIASYPSDLTLSVIYEMWSNDEILIPEFQRNFVWNIKQSSLLIESFLIGLPIPQVFFYVDEQNKSQVIDGQQRITSVVYYMNGYFGDENIHGKKQVFRLQGLDESSPFHKKRFEDLSESSQRKLRGAVLRAINIRQLNPLGEPTSIYHIFERLNTGGTPLKPQEIRNCVFRGKFVSILRKLNADKNWRSIIGKNNLDKHQKDVELILRIFGLSYFFEDYEKPMKEFLNRVMAREKKGTSKQVASFEEHFPKIAELIVARLGAKPFHIRGRLNSSALDSVFGILLSFKGKIPIDLQARYDRLKKDPTFSETTFYSTSDLSVVKRRFEATSNHLIK